MSVNQTTGVAALARILVRLGEGDAPTVAELAAGQGVTRTTAFDIVRRLEAAQLARRDPTGRISPGSAASALGFAAFGIAPLQGPAEALVAWLHEQTDARAELLANGTVLVGFGKPQPAHDLEAALLDATGLERARLHLAWRPQTTRGERQHIAAQFERVRLSLQAYLTEENDT